MLAERYTPERLREYLNVADRWLMLLRLDTTLIGYCSYALAENPPEIKLSEMKAPATKAREMKLEQLYLLPEYYGQRFGRLMLRHIEEQSRLLGCLTLLLQVNKRNEIASTFIASPVLRYARRLYSTSAMGL